MNIRQTVIEKILFSQTSPSILKKTVENLIKIKLKPPDATVKAIAFHCVHRMGTRKPASGRPQPILTRLEHSQQNELVKRCSRELKGTDFSVNIKFPIRMRFMEGGSCMAISVERLFVNGMLYSIDPLLPGSSNFG